MTKTYVIDKKILVPIHDRIMSGGGFCDPASPCYIYEIKLDTNGNLIVNRYGEHYGISNKDILCQHKQEIININNNIKMTNESIIIFKLLFDEIDSIKYIEFTRDTGPYNKQIFYVKNIAVINFVDSKLFNSIIECLKNVKLDNDKKYNDFKNNVILNDDNNINMLIYLEEYNDPNVAIAREKQLKNWNRKKKINLIIKSNPKFEDFSSTL